MGDAISKCTEGKDVGDMDMNKLQEGKNPSRGAPPRAGPPPTDIGGNEEMMKMMKEL